MNYIVREDGIGRVIDLDEMDNPDINVFLEEEYPNIYEAYVNDEYNMEHHFSNFFHELVYDNKVVGFYTYYNAREFQDQTYIEEFYVIPEYRGNKILINTLVDLTVSNKNFTLHKPIRCVMDILIENGFAWYFSKNLVRSIFKFSSSYNDVIINKKLKNIYNNTDNDILTMNIFTNLYDMNTNSIIFNDPMGLLIDEDVICMSNPRQYDISKYKLSNKLRKIDKKYLKNTLRTIQHNILDNEEKEAEVLEKLFENINVDKIIDDNQINTFHSKYDIPVDTLLSIRDDVQRAYDAKDINYEHITTRFEYLVKNYDSVDKDEPELKYSTDCAYCDSFILKNGICQVCGYNNFDKNIENIQKQIKAQIDSSTGLYHSLMEKIEENKLDSDKVFDSQLEIAEVSFLHYIDNNANYIFLVNIEDEYQISEEVVIKSLQDKKLIETIENNDVDDEKSYLYQQKIDNYNPTLIEYKLYMHRDYKYKINKKGRRYYKQNKCATTYIKYLHNLPYYEFKQYYQTNKENMDIYELLNNFVDKKEYDAVENESMAEYMNTCISKALVTKEDNEYAANIIKSLICDLNKFFIQDYNDLRKKPISVENEILIEDNIEFLREQDIEDVFERAYDKILLTSLKENKNDRLDDIKEIIDSDNINYINKELEFKYDI